MKKFGLFLIIWALFVSICFSEENNYSDEECRQIDNILSERQEEVKKLDKLIAERNRKRMKLEKIETALIEKSKGEVIVKCGGFSCNKHKIGFSGGDNPMNIDFPLHYVRKKDIYFYGYGDDWVLCEKHYNILPNFYKKVFKKWSKEYNQEYSENYYLTSSYYQTLRQEGYSVEAAKRLTVIYNKESSNENP